MDLKLTGTFKSLQLQQLVALRGQYGGQN